MTEKPKFRRGPLPDLSKPSKLRNPKKKAQFAGEYAEDNIKPRHKPYKRKKVVTDDGV